MTMGKFIEQVTKKPDKTGFPKRTQLRSSAMKKYFTLVVFSSLRATNGESVMHKQFRLSSFPRETA